MYSSLDNEYIVKINYYPIIILLSIQTIILLCISITLIYYLNYATNWLNSHNSDITTFLNQIDTFINHIDPLISDLSICVSDFCTNTN